MGDNIELNNYRDNYIAIGIDLGTTNTCAYFYIDGRLESLENKEGERLTPTHVHLSSQKVLVGKYARKMNAYNQREGYYAPRRFLGQNFFQAQDLGTTTRTRGSLIKTPQEICAIILGRVKEDVEDKLGCKINEAVITVPAYFDKYQRRETLKAARQAGFAILNLLNEPKASLLHFHYETEMFKNKHYSLVYDLGGGTFDVSIMKKDKYEDEWVVEVTDGDTQLGGDDFDKLVADYVCTELKRLYGYDMREDKRGMNELLILCEEAKRNLSFIEETFIELKGFVPSEKNAITITLGRQKLEELIMEMLKKTIDITDRCVQRAKIDIASIDEVILAGGSTRIPKIRSLLSEYFNGKTLSELVNPDESVAKGAALQAAMLSMHPRQQIKKITLLDIVPPPLEYNLWCGKMFTLIPKKPSILALLTENKVIFDARHRQRIMKFEVYEKAKCKENVFLTLDITLPPSCQTIVYLTMNVDKNGIVTFNARDTKFDEVRMFHTSGMRTYQEIYTPIGKHAKSRFIPSWGDEKFLYDYCEQVILFIRAKNLQDKYKEIIDRCEKIRSVCPTSENDVNTERWIMEIDLICDPLIEKHEFEFDPSRRNVDWQSFLNFSFPGRYIPKYLK